MRLGFLLIAGLSTSCQHDTRVFSTDQGIAMRDAYIASETQKNHIISTVKPPVDANVEATMRLILKMTLQLLFRMAMYVFKKVAVLRML